MFGENLKNLRTQRGLSQEELAERLHVVRQTVSKWEKGLSVPDADLLIRIAEIFETSVSTLLGDTVEPPEDKNIIAQKLELLNALLAEKNRRSRRTWKVIAIILISITAITTRKIGARDEHQLFRSFSCRIRQGNGGPVYSASNFLIAYRNLPDPVNGISSTNLTSIWVPGSSFLAPLMNVSISSGLQSVFFMMLNTA